MMRENYGGWGFNAVELLNDPRPIFIDLDDPHSSGYFEDWASFINLGHKVTGMGVSDVHGPGWDRSTCYFSSS